MNLKNPIKIENVQVFTHKRSSSKFETQGCFSTTFLGYLLKIWQKCRGMGTDFSSCRTGTGGSCNTATFVYERWIILLGFTWWIKGFRAIKDVNFIWCISCWHCNWSVYKIASDTFTRYITLLKGQGITSFFHTWSQNSTIPRISKFNVPFCL